MNYDQISNFSQKETISFLQSKGLIPSEKRCSKCLSFSSLSIRSETADGFAWRCVKKNCPKEWESIKKDTFFENSGRFTSKRFKIDIFKIN